MATGCQPDKPQVKATSANALFCGIFIVIFWSFYCICWQESYTISLDKPIFCIIFVVTALETLLHSNKIQCNMHNESFSIHVHLVYGQSQHTAELGLLPQGLVQHLWDLRGCMYILKQTAYLCTNTQSPWILLCFRNEAARGVEYAGSEGGSGGLHKALKTWKTERSREKMSEKVGTWWGMEGRRLQQWDMISILLQGLSYVSLQRACMIFIHLVLGTHKLIT